HRAAIAGESEHRRLGPFGTVERVDLTVDPLTAEARRWRPDGDFLGLQGYRTEICNGHGYHSREHP
ncbi:MAG: hypothetical protein ACK56I_34345, partial [bacterium]